MLSLNILLMVLIRLDKPLLTMEILNGDTIIFIADGANFDITFNNPNSFSPSTNTIHIDPDNPKN